MTIAFRGAYTRPINGLLIDAGAGALVSTLHNGTALPMVGTIALRGVAALLCLQLLVLRPLAATPVPQ